MLSLGTVGILGRTAVFSLLRAGKRLRQWGGCTGPSRFLLLSGPGPQDQFFLKCALLSLLENNSRASLKVELGNSDFDGGYQERGAGP